MLPPGPEARRRPKISDSRTTPWGWGLRLELGENIDYVATLARVRLLDTFDTQGVEPFGGPLRETPASPILFSSMVLERLQQVFEHKQLRERKDHHDEDAYQSSRKPSDQRHLGQFTNV